MARLGSFLSGELNVSEREKALNSFAARIFKRDNEAKISIPCKNLHSARLVALDECREILAPELAVMEGLEVVVKRHGVAAAVSLLDLDIIEVIRCQPDGFQPLKDLAARHFVDSFSRVPLEDVRGDVLLKGSFVVPRNVGEERGLAHEQHVEFPPRAIPDRLEAAFFGVVMLV